MRAEYDLSKLTKRKNPYAKMLKKPVRMNLEMETIDYFMQLAEESGLPYRSLINLYLRNCVQERLKLKWVE